MAGLDSLKAGLVLKFRSVPCPARTIARLCSLLLPLPPPCAVLYCLPDGGAVSGCIVGALLAPLLLQTAHGAHLGCLDARRVPPPSRASSDATATLHGALSCDTCFLASFSCSGLLLLSPSSSLVRLLMFDIHRLFDLSSLCFVFFLLFFLRLTPRLSSPSRSVARTCRKTTHCGLRWTSAAPRCCTGAPGTATLTWPRFASLLPSCSAAS